MPVRQWHRENVSGIQKVAEIKWSMPEQAPTDFAGYFFFYHNFVKHAWKKNLVTVVLGFFKLVIEYILK